MNAPLRVLLIEDSESDAAIVLRHLRKGWDPVEWVRVEDDASLRAELRRDWDVVISDNNLPQFDAASALAAVREGGGDLPFLVVSGAIGEEAAVALMKGGAQDYLSKDNLVRLVPAVAREIADARERARMRAVKAALRDSELRFRTLVEMAPEAIMVQTKGILAWGNPAALRLFGAREESELVGRPILELFRAELHASVTERIRALNESRVSMEMAEEVCLRLDGSEIYVEISAVPFEYGGDAGALVFARDISSRKQAEAAAAAQLEELRRWHAATVGRESRVLELKKEVNELLSERGEEPRYPSTAGKAELPR